MKEKTIENAWSILLKFGKEENLQKLRAGQFYMKNLQYYVDLEKGTSDEDVGDMYDGQMMLQDVKYLCLQPTRMSSLDKYLPQLHLLIWVI